NCPPNYEGGCGVIFRIALDTKLPKLAVLYNFCELADCADGVFPQSVQQNSNGTILGTTYRGGGNDGDADGYGGGTVFQMSGKRYKVLHAFCSKRECRDGEYPTTGLAVGAAGALFSVTFNVGNHVINGAGTVFKLTP